MSNEIHVVRCAVRPPGSHEILLMKRTVYCNNARSRGKWELPGGKVDFGDSLPDAAEREVFEESGLRVQLLHWPKEIETYTIPDGKHVGKRCHIWGAMAVTLSGTRVTLNPDEHTAAEFISNDASNLRPDTDTLSLAVLAQLSLHHSNT